MTPCGQKYDTKHSVCPIDGSPWVVSLICTTGDPCPDCREKQDAAAEVAEKEK